MSGMQFYAADQPSLTKNAFQACEMDVQVAVTKNEPVRSFRKAVVIVIAIEKMRNSPMLFTDEDLTDILSTVLEPVRFDHYGCTEASNSIYQFSNHVVCNIQDADQKSLILQEPPQLVAMHLQGPNINCAVKLKMSVYRPKVEAGTQKIPVALNIKGKKLYLSCVLKGGQPVLQLEVSRLGPLFSAVIQKCGKGGSCTAQSWDAFLCFSKDHIAECWAGIPTQKAGGGPGLDVSQNLIGWSLGVQIAAKLKNSF
ncbi:interleukin-1 beta-like isoform 1-T1 [Liasis olivaceus]